MILTPSTGNFNVKLTQKPFENIAVTLSSSLTELSIDTPQIIFTSDNWNTNQTIGLTGSIDSNSISETVTITGNATGISNTGTVQYLENGIIIAGANSIKANNTARIIIQRKLSPYHREVLQIQKLLSLQVQMESLIKQHLSGQVFQLLTVGEHLRITSTEPFSLME